MGETRESTHRGRYLKRSEALVNIVPGWKLLGKEVGQGVRAPLETPTYQCSNSPKDDTPIPILATLPKVLLQRQVQFLGKSMGASSTSPPN